MRQARLLVGDAVRAVRNQVDDRLIALLDRCTQATTADAIRLAAEVDEFAIDALDQLSLALSDLAGAEEPPEYDAGWDY